MTNILGLDIGRNVGVGIILSEFPRVPVKRFYTEHKKDFFKIKPTYKLTKKQLKNGFKDLTFLESLQVNEIVLEPTGGWYAAIWVKWAQYHQIKVNWVGHADLSKGRGHYKFQNKRDDIDALCLACLYFDPHWVDDWGRKWWLSFHVEEIMSIRRAYFDIIGCEKIKNALINQNRQRLALEFPETCERRTEPSEKNGISPFWAWLSETHDYASVNNLFALSAAKKLGIEISKLTRLKAKHITDNESVIFELLHQVKKLLLDNPEFAPYLSVFHSFRFGLDSQILMLIQTYPFSRFLVNGACWIEWEDTDNGKRRKINRSLRHFQAYIGLAYSYAQSGDTKKKKFHGSGLARSKLYMWITDVVIANYEENFGDFINNPDLTDRDLEKMCILHPNIPGAIGSKIADKIVRLYRAGVRGSDIQIRLLFQITRLLFQELYKSSLQ